MTISKVIFSLHVTISFTFFKKKIRSKHLNTTGIFIPFSLFNEQNHDQHHHFQERKKIWLFYSDIWFVRFFPPSSQTKVLKWAPKPLAVYIYWISIQFYHEFFKLCFICNKNLFQTIYFFKTTTSTRFPLSFWMVW